MQRIDVTRAMRRAASRGLTLVELVIVITLIGVLTGAIAVGVLKAQKSANVGAAKARQPGEVFHPRRYAEAFRIKRNLRRRFERLLQRLMLIAPQLFRIPILRAPQPEVP